MLKYQRRVRGVRWLLAATAALLTVTAVPAVQVQAADYPQVQALSAGNGFSCALISGSVSCWGVNNQGQLGDGTRTNRSTPVVVRGLGAGVRGISVGTDHACAVTAEQRIRCWGSNSSGQLGVPGTAAQVVPQSVPLPGAVRSLSAGQHYTCALTVDVYCWGRNFGGQLGSARAGGDRATRVADLPEAADRVRTFIGFACARLVDGTVACWGDNRQGFLGAGHTEAQAKPVRVIGQTGPAGWLSAGQAYHSCLAEESGPVRCWGTDTFGEAGNGERPKSAVAHSAPVQVRGLSGSVSRVAVGEYHSCALASGRPQCWGNNDWGQLGDNSNEDRSSAVPVVGLGGPVSEIAAGFSHTCAATVSGAIWCWGYNGNGQLGDGTFTSRNFPTLVRGIGAGA
ncbi:MAG: RCC1 domain-containing protein [Angustibacter sp.]